MKKMLEDLTSRRFGKWIVLNRSEIKSKRTYWNCICDCGNIKKVLAQNLKSGISTNCGCENKKVHNKDDRRLYNIWGNMIQRCYNKNHNKYKYYGEKGICINKEWKDDFSNFKEWSLNNGYKDNLTIDRMNNDKNYEPSNCQWVTMKEQNKNKSNNFFITINGETKLLEEWSIISGISRNTLKYRFKNGWSEDKILIPTKK